jgi:7-carboxy-7-deazaguanine synthase
MRIAELYPSIQGEGLLTGTRSVFVRVSGCNLRCRYCDTPYASGKPEGEDLSVEDLVDRIVGLGLSHVVLTGGEPMLFAELIPLAAELRRLGRHVTVETAGTLYLPVECDLISISPKLSNSIPTEGADPRWAVRHDHARHSPETVRRLVAEHEYQVKFVIDDVRDCAEVEEYLAEFPQIDRDRVLLMPQGIDPAELAEKGRWLEPYCVEHDLKYCPRRQIEWFGPRRGT